MSFVDDITALLGRLGEPVPAVTCWTWFPGADLRTHPSECWADKIHDHVGGDW